MTKWPGAWSPSRHCAGSRRRRNAPSPKSMNAWGSCWVLKAGSGEAMAEEYLTDDEQLEAVKHLIMGYAPWLIGGVPGGAAALFRLLHFRNFTNARAWKAATE